MSSEEKTFNTEVISSGRITIPKHIKSEMGLIEGDSIQVKVSRRRYKHLLLYKGGPSQRLYEMEVIETDTPLLTEIREKARQALEGKSVEWAFLPAGDWIIKPEGR